MTTPRQQTAPLQGWGFPFRIEPSGGGVARAVDFDKIDANLRHLLASRTGERAMLRSYGAGVHHRLQEPNTAPLRALLRHEIEAALRRFMPEVTLTAPPELRATGDTLTVVLTYAVRPRDVVRRLAVELDPGSVAVTAAPVDYTNIGYEALRAAMLELARERLPEWTDQSEGDLGVLLVELFAYATDLTLYYQTRIAANLLPETADEPDAVISLLRLIGYEPAPPAPATVDLTIAVDDADLTTRVLPARTAFTVEGPGGQLLTFETTTDVVLDPLSPEGPDGLRRFTPLPVVEGTTVTDDPAGLADGTPNQSVALRRAPVVAGTVGVTVTEGGGLTRWQEVPTLADSTPADRHFVTRRDADGTTTVRFGDGTNGMVPPRTGPTTEVRVIATYRVGGGRAGNVAARQRFRTNAAGVKEAWNPLPAAGGAPAEDLDRAKALAPRLYRTQDRAVTRADHEDIALQVPGVGKVRAEATSWNDVVLYVAPTGRVRPPSELLTRDLLAHVERFRMAGQTVTVSGPRPVDVFLGVVIRAHPFYAEASVRHAVEDAVAGYLAFDAVDFGQQIFLSRVYDLLQDLEQVASLTVFKFSRTPELPPDVLDRPDIAARGVLELEPLELPRPGYRDADTLPAVGLPGVDLVGRPPIVTIIEGAAP